MSDIEQEKASDVAESEPPVKRSWRRVLLLPGFLASLLFLLLLGQLLFLSTGGLTRIVPEAQIEDELALQGRDPSVVRQERGQFAPMDSGGGQGAAFLGGIPVAFGENAPDKLGVAAGGGGTPGAMEGVPGAMAGVPGAMAGTPGDSKSQAVPGKTSGVPGLTKGTPGDSKSQAVPGKTSGVPGLTKGTPGETKGTPGETKGHGVPGKLQGSPGSVEKHEPNDEGDQYREALIMIYLLEQKGGQYGLTPMQARHLLRTLKETEAVKSAVPDAQKVILKTLTVDQLSLIRGRLSALASEGKRTSPDLLDAYTAEAIDAMGGTESIKPSPGQGN